jgi:hypothetical protein
MHVVQIADGPVLVASAFAIIILASVIPIIRGADLNISGAGPFTQRAEACSSNITCPETQISRALKLCKL